MSSKKTDILPSVQIINEVILPHFLPPEKVKECMELIPNPGDIVLSTYPKCGTNWTTQILLVLKNKGIPPQSGEEFLNCCPYLELTGTEPLKILMEPRLYKTHMDYAHAPRSSDAKYIVVVRNPKDCLISLFHFMQSSLFGFKGGKFDMVFELFIKGESFYNDYFDHVLSWYDHRNDTNVLFLYYEKMKDDIGKVIKAIGLFLGGQFMEAVQDPKTFQDVIYFSSLEYMKKVTNEQVRTVLEKIENSVNTQTNSDQSTTKETSSDQENTPIVRKGIVGDWRNVLTSEQNKILDELIHRRLKGTEMYDYWISNGCI